MSEQLEFAIAAIGGLSAIVVATVGVLELRKSIKEKHRELRFKMAITAKELIDTVRNNPKSAAALKMLDWSDEVFQKPDGSATRPLTHAFRRKALRTNNLVFDSDEVFIRDCFDVMMEEICLSENYIKIGMVEFTDLSHYFSYYMKLAKRDDEAQWLEPYAKEYGFEAFLAFRDRFHYD